MRVIIHDKPNGDGVDVVFDPPLSTDTARNSFAHLLGVAIVQSFRQLDNVTYEAPTAAAPQTANN